LLEGDLIGALYCGCIEWSPVNLHSTRFYRKNCLILCFISFDYKMVSNLNICKAFFMKCPYHHYFRFLFDGLLHRGCAWKVSEIPNFRIYS